ncbi:MAG: hypothetical protein WBI07_18325 [Mobilitalea sp.]
MRGKVSQEMFDCIPEIDYNSGSRYFLGNMENYTSALLSTLKSVKSKLYILQSMIHSDEYMGLQTIFRTLGKMLMNVGAKGIADSTYELETILINEDIFLLQEQLKRYLGELEEFSDHLELLFKKIDVKSNKKDDASSFLDYDFTKTKESIKQSADLLERKII